VTQRGSLMQQAWCLFFPRRHLVSTAPVKSWQIRVLSVLFLGMGFVCLCVGTPHCSGGVSQSVSQSGFYL